MNGIWTSTRLVGFEPARRALSIKAGAWRSPTATSASSAVGLEQRRPRLGRREGPLGSQDWWIEGFYTVLRDPLTPSPPAVRCLSAPTGFNGRSRPGFPRAVLLLLGIADHEFDVYGFFGVPGRVVHRDNRRGGRLDRSHDRRPIKGRIWASTTRWVHEPDRPPLPGSDPLLRLPASCLPSTWTGSRGSAWSRLRERDRHPGDGRRNTFDRFFPFFHYYQGFADTFGWKNAKELSAYVKVPPNDWLTVHWTSTISGGTNLDAGTTTRGRPRPGNGTAGRRWATRRTARRGTSGSS